MILVLLLLVSSPAPDPLSDFDPVGGFQDLEASASPKEFGIMLVESASTDSNAAVAGRILLCLEYLPEDCSPHLWRVPASADGHPEIAALCGGHTLPSVAVLVGHCGFLVMDRTMLEAELTDAWYLWGDPESMRGGICRFCRRCHPEMIQQRQ